MSGKIAMKKKKCDSVKNHITNIYNLKLIYFVFFKKKLIFLKIEVPIE